LIQSLALVFAGASVFIGDVIRLFQGGLPLLSFQA
jgi:hypothetical protein